MSGLFGGQDVTNTNITKLSPQQKELLRLSMPYMRKFARQGIDLPDGSGIVPQNDIQKQAQQMVLANAEKQQQTVDSAGNYSNWLFSGGALDPNSNPGLMGTIEAAVRPIYQNLTESVLPNIRGGAVGSGNFGSSRQGIAEGIASRGASTAAGDAASKIAFDAYNAGLDATSKGLALLPQTTTSYNIPAQSIGTVGDIQQNIDQQLLDEARNRFLQEQLLPLQVGQELIGGVGSIPSAGSTSTSSGGGTNPLSAILGLGSLFLGGAGGVGTGGLLSFL